MGLDMENYVEVSETFNEKLESALDFLGERWVLHPKYEFDPKHQLHCLVSDTTGKHKARYQ